MTATLTGIQKNGGKVELASTHSGAIFKRLGHSSTLLFERADGSGYALVPEGSDVKLENATRIKGRVVEFKPGAKITFSFVDERPVRIQNRRFVQFQYKTSRIIDQF